MKVLFCSPYLDSDNVVKGGINTWGKNILSYAATEISSTDLILIPVSFDRTYARSGRKSRLSRIIFGLLDYAQPIKQASKAIRHANPDVIHICTSAGYGLFRDLYLLRKAKRNGLRLAIHFHFGRIPDLYRQNNWEWRLISKIIRLCDIAIVMDRVSENTLLEAGFSNIRYLPNPIGVETMRQIKLLKNEYKRIPNRLLFAGHVLKTKGVCELVQACAMIQGLRLRIVGKCSSEMRAELERLAFVREEGNWLEIVGELDHKSVISEFLQANLFVFPSYTEGFPNVILEAMACGCPIVSSDVGAIPEMLDVSGEQCGICFKPQSVDELFQSLIKVLPDSKMMEDYAAKGEERVRNQYSMSVIWQQLINIWEIKCHSKVE